MFIMWKIDETRKANKRNFYSDLKLSREKLMNRKNFHKLVLTCLITFTLFHFHLPVLNKLFINIIP